MQDVFVFMCLNVYFMFNIFLALYESLWYVLVHISYPKDASNINDSLTYYLNAVHSSFTTCAFSG